MTQLMPPQSPAEPPATLVAWLPSAGLNEKRATRHVFVRRERVDLSDLKYGERGPRSFRPGVALVYKCTETGAERRWGLE